MLIAGTDEAGRGPLAGPVVAAAVVFEPGIFVCGVKDSKQLSAKNREKVYEQITAQAKAWAIVAVGHERILRVNIREASRLAMAKAVERVCRRTRVDLVLVDGNTPIECSLPQRTVVGGDRSEFAISAASILAKVFRDRLMRLIDSKYPSYGFCKHMGYPTEAHRAAIGAYGPCRVHRAGFSGVKEFLGFKGADSGTLSGLEGLPQL
ncbi:MAG: ribonuclease HII [Proteobacteria bacterium]|nr:MAG: ribonuclease HII [Pseudomonadota bacterium]